jgi:hypothetical protein
MFNERMNSMMSLQASGLGLAQAPGATEVQRDEAQRCASFIEGDWGGMG